MDRKWDADDLALRLENHKEYAPCANEIVMEAAARFIRKQERRIGFLVEVLRYLRKKQKIAAFSEQQEKSKPETSGRDAFYDFELCAEYEELKASLHSINHLGYELISVTQDHRGVYTLFFRRPSA